MTDIRHFNLNELAKKDFTTLNQAIGMLVKQQEVLKSQLYEAIKKSDIVAYEKMIEYFPKLLENDTGVIYNIITQNNNTPNIAFLEKLLSHPYFSTNLGNKIKTDILKDLFTNSFYNIELYKELEKSNLFSQHILDKVINVFLSNNDIIKIEDELFHQFIINRISSKSLKINEIILKLISLDNIDKLEPLFSHNYLSYIDNNEGLQNNLLHQALNAISPKTTSFLLERYKYNTLYKSLTMNNIIENYDNKKIIFFISERERCSSFRRLVLDNFILDAKFLQAFPSKLAFAKEGVWLEFTQFVISKNDISLINQFLDGIKNSNDVVFKEYANSLCQKAITYLNLEQNSYNNKTTKYIKL